MKTVDFSLHNLLLGRINFEKEGCDNLADALRVYYTYIWSYIDLSVNDSILMKEMLIENGLSDDPKLEFIMKRNMDLFEAAGRILKKETKNYQTRKRLQIVDDKGEITLD